MPRVGRRPAAVLAGGLLVTLGAVAPGGEAGAQAVARSPGDRPTIALRLRPRAGDTLMLRFEQAMYRAAPGAAPGLALGAPPGGRPTSSMTVLSRSIVEATDLSGSVVVGIVDSVRWTVAGGVTGVAAEALERARRAMQGRRTRMRVATDGAMRWLADGAAGRQGGIAATLAAGLPGALPEAPVAVGATWTRTMPLPWADAVRATAAPRLEVTFRLDSLTRGRSVAHLSMRGRLAGGGGGARVAGAAVVGGAAVGALQVDLARGWVTDSRTDFLLDLEAGDPMSGARARPVRVRVAQRLTVR